MICLRPNSAFFGGLMLQIAVYVACRGIGGGELPVSL
jgi:hypothetical protein